MKLLKLLAILIGVFSISVYFRTPYVEKEVSPYNETSITILTVLENWKTQGVSKYYFAPVQTWQNEGDKYNANYKRLEDKKGNNYYVSYPPFAFLFSYAIISIIDIEPGQVFIQILNIILHFISAFFIYLIICKYCKSDYLKIYPPAIVGFISYTFIPVLLFIHTFDFFSEMMGQVFFIIGIYLYQLIEETKEKTNKKLLFLFGFNLFILIYTEWIGVFFAFTLLLISLIKFRKEIFYRKLFKTVLLFSFLAISLLVFQYSYINGFANLTRSLSLRFLERSGFFGEHYSDLGISYTNFDSYKLLFKQVHQTLIGFGYVALILLAWWLFKNKFRLRQMFIRNLLVIIIVLPIIIEFFVFFNATLIHYICWAKFGIPMSIGIALLIDNFSKKSIVLYKINLLTLTMVAVLFFSIAAFKTHAKEITHKNDHLRDISLIIEACSKDDESIFVSLPKEIRRFNTYFSYMSKRNIMNVESLEVANKILKEKQKVKGVFYTFEPHSNQYSIKHINLISDTTK